MFFMHAGLSLCLGHESIFHCGKMFNISVVIIKYTWDSFNTSRNDVSLVHVSPMNSKI
jgi:hypothetical protein